MEQIPCPASTPLRSKVLIINGSPRHHGNTSIALTEIKKTLVEEGCEVEVVRIGDREVRGCIACEACSKLGKCTFDDVVNECASKLAEADGLVVGSPVYFGSANATTIAFLDRLFYSTGSIDKTMKVGCSVAVARRGGIETTWDEVNKYFGITGMPIASGQYWNGMFGRAAGEAADDAEGLQQMRTLAHNMAFLMRAIAREKEAGGIPKPEPRIRTNFIR